MNEQNAGTGRTSSQSDSTSGMAAHSHEVAEQLKEAVVDQAHRVRDRAQSAKQHSADRLRDVATQFRSMESALREDDPVIAKAAARASDGIETVANYVGSASARSVMRDTEQLARRQPLLFFGGAFLAGLAAARFLKSSRSEGSSNERPRTQGAHPVGESSTPRLQQRPSSFLPSPDAAALPNTESTVSRYNAAFGRDLPDRAPADPRGTTPMASPPMPNTPPPRRRDENGGGAGTGTLS